MTQQLLRWQQRLAGFTTLVGRSSAWLALLLVLGTVLVVVLRYGRLYWIGPFCPSH